MALQQREQPSYATVDPFDHSGVDGVVSIGGIGSARVAVNQALLRLYRSMHRVIGHVEEERIAAVFFDEALGSRSELVRQVIPSPGPGDLEPLVRCEHRPVRAQMTGRKAFVESAFFRQIFAASEVPLADTGGGIAGGSKWLCNNSLVEWQAQGKLRLQQLGMRQHVSRQVLGQAEPSGPASGENTGPRRRTVGGRGIGIRETHALFGETVDVGRSMVGVAIGPDIGVAHVIKEQEDDVGRILGLCRSLGHQPERHGGA